MIRSKAYAALDAASVLAPYEIERRDPGPDDVQIQILYCGVCHSGIHTARNEWKNTIYPSVPGHEIVGRVVAVGARVSKFKVGDLADVGCMVDSCGHCPSCGEGEEQYCDNGFTGTYNGPLFGGENTHGGYSQTIVVKESFVLRISHREEQLASVAPLLCAGITTYSPLRHWGAGPGKKVGIAGIVGLGGLGHMGVKIAHAWAPMSCCSLPRRARSPAASGSVPTRSACPPTPSRWPAWPASSISSSIPWRRRTTSTPTCNS